MASLYAKLQKLNTQKTKKISEEDVKDIYIETLKLKKEEYSKNLIDIQIGEHIWVEAKLGSVDLYSMFNQSLHYVHQALVKGEHLPSFLMVIDQEKAAILPYAQIESKFARIHQDIQWGKSASDVKALNEEDRKRLQDLIVHDIIAFYFRNDGEEEAFKATFNEIKTSYRLTRTDITPKNLEEAYESWCHLIGAYLRLTDAPRGENNSLSESELTFLFYADLMHDGTVSVYKRELPASARLIFADGERLFQFDGREAKVTDEEQYLMYWNRWHRPPKEQYRDELISRRDSLMPLGERRYDGEFYTPIKLVRQAYLKLSQVLGENWQKEYYVWDMACGTGNLEQLHEQPHRLFLSTLKQREVDIMKLNAKNSPRYHKLQEASIWQYDYLNDDVTEEGTIDYRLTNKVPAELQEAIRAGKKILVLMNPPYGEAGTTLNFESKSGIAKNKHVAKYLMKKDWGAATNELYAQFLARIQQEIPQAVIAMFSTLKYVNAPNFEQFRSRWQAEYLGGFVFHSRNFDTVKGNFPIAFLLWNLANPQAITEIRCDVLKTDVKDKEGAITIEGEKLFFNQPTKTYLNKWIDRPKSNPELSRVIPLKNAIKVFDGTQIRLDKWSDNAVAYMWVKANDFQNAGQQTALFSSVWGSGDGFYVNPENLAQAAVVFAVRRAIKATWLNDRDQFLQPTKPLTRVFELDALVYMLFSGSNLTAGADKLLYNDQEYTLVNHFFPFTPSEVGSTKLESRFMVEYLQENHAHLSAEALEVLAMGKQIYRWYFQEYDNFPPHVIEEFKLGRSDVGWYQIRNALAKSRSGKQKDDYETIIKASYATLTQKIEKGIYEFGFLRQ
ncbi:DUF4238 domain-containing protein [Entomospira entomophila]|uniref:DUF4238 domain-containing protein n=1 Tax=Entomospira entomophila TaxID=2719988 RepID=A0A968GCG2_9SPIO|nr:DUF4238 domain-containing protein [Entomospira entomophilus]NIZ41078.1 DUF4238 domain-containing protein [Entomospira entomophilus]WDI35287.1 DUF4238 domain-containing protein [Entomospira entomophilus]